MMRTLSGPFQTQELRGGLWYVTAGAPDGVKVYLRTQPGTRGATLQGRDIQRLDLKWHNAGITVRVTGTDSVLEFEAATVIIHEARMRLYENLPLAAFDAKARRFWQRVFLLIRIPGGRYLLRLIARRKR